VDVTALGTLLKFGLPGLALGLVLGVIPGVLRKKVSETQHRTLATCFKYAVILFGLVCVVNGITLYFKYLDDGRIARMTVAVDVQPSFGKDFPKAAPRISTDLSPKPIGGRVDVSTRGTNSVVHVDVSDMRTLLINLYQANARKDEQIVALQANNEEVAKLYASIIQTPSAVHGTINKVLAAQNGVAVAKETCRESNHVFCGWARLASGDVSAAQASFSAAASDASLPDDQAASAQVGLGYTLLIEGKASEAFEQTKKAAKTGDEGATKQLRAISVESTASDPTLNQRG
jgi:hypothetical protein